MMRILIFIFFILDWRCRGCVVIIIMMTVGDAEDARVVIIIIMTVGDAEDAR